MSPLLAGLALLVAGGLVGLLLPRLQALATAVSVAGCVAGAYEAVLALSGRAPVEWRLAVPLAFGEPVLGLDALSAFFLLPLFVLSALAFVYGPAYLRAHEPGRSVALPGFVFSVLVASMALVLVARDAALFLVSWELMTLSSYLLVTLDHGEASVRRAGFVYLVAGHVCVAALFALFLLLGARAGSLEFGAFARAPALSTGFAVTVALLALVGFGTKAGLVPLHVWLPEAHAAAPTHVSALMSGIMIKLGIYGILRVLGWLTPAPWWGPTLLVLGFAGALLGVSLALYQRDLKRVLAYSSIENVGLVLIGLGLGYWGLTSHAPYLAALGFTAGLVHLWNHVAMKGLMFLSAGSVVAATGSRDLERLGGLASRLPVTTVGLVVGGVAISALPPFAGFTGEWLLYLGLLEGGVARGGAAGLLALLAVGLLAFVGGLAAFCFVRLTGVSMLGSPRAPSHHDVHEPGAAIIGPIVALAATVTVLGVAPALVLGPVGRVLAAVAPALGTQELAPISASLGRLGAASAVVWLVIGLVALVLKRTSRSAADSTWGCGYTQPTARMQYTGAAFAEYIVTRLLPGWMAPARSSPARPTGAFAGPTRLTSTYDDPLTRSVYQPSLERWAARMTRLHWIQQGILHVYFLYIFMVVVIAFAWLALRAWMGS